MTIGNNHTLSLPPKNICREKKDNCEGIKSEIRLSVADAHTQTAMDVLIIMHTLTVLLNVLRWALNKIQHFKPQQT